MSDNPQMSILGAIPAASAALVVSFSEEDMLVMESNTENENGGSQHWTQEPNNINKQLPYSTIFGKSITATYVWQMK